MKFDKNTHFYIAKNIMDSVFTKNKPLEYKKWLDFINKHEEEFVWHEETNHGKETLKSIDKVPDKFKKRVLASLDKIKCYKEFDKIKDHYNINIGFNARDNWVSIGFERTPKLADLKIFLEMAAHLDALLLKDGNEVVVYPIS